MTETNVQKFYRILAEKTKTYGTKKEMMAQLGFEVAKLNSDRTRLNSDERAGRFPPVRLMIIQKSGGATRDSEAERQRKLKRKLKREMYLERSFGI